MTEKNTKNKILAKTESPKQESIKVQVQSNDNKIIHQLKEENSQLKKENEKLRGFLMALKNKPVKVSFYDPEDYREDSIIGEGATSSVKVIVKEEKYAKKELKEFTHKSMKAIMRES